MVQLITFTRQRLYMKMLGKGKLIIKFDDDYTNLPKSHIHMEPKIILYFIIYFTENIICMNDFQIA